MVTPQPDAMCCVYPMGTLLAPCDRTTLMTPIDSFNTCYQYGTSTVKWDCWTHDGICHERNLPLPDSPQNQVTSHEPQIEMNTMTWICSVCCVPVLHLQHCMTSRGRVPRASGTSANLTQPSAAHFTREGQVLHWHPCN